MPRLPDLPRFPSAAERLTHRSLRQNASAVVLQFGFQDCHFVREVASVCLPLVALEHRVTRVRSEATALALPKHGDPGVDVERVSLLLELRDERRLLVHERLLTLERRDGKPDVVAREVLHVVLRLRLEAHHLGPLDDRDHFVRPRVPDEDRTIQSIPNERGSLDLPHRLVCLSVLHRIPPAVRSLQRVELLHDVPSAQVRPAEPIGHVLKNVRHGPAVGELRSPLPGMQHSMHRRLELLRTAGWGGPR
mmetsp:Transcript_21532/g.54262  ORF Transcript_21532/g.54262 Transcript_21532/m.54262 type:complete len:249 (-) Transcript_21532:500-1246(-)